MNQISELSLTYLVFCKPLLVSDCVTDPGWVIIGYCLFSLKRFLRHW